MRLWRLNEPRGSQVACFSIVGTWRQTSTRQGLCPACTSAPSVALTPPFVIEWLPYGDQLADFVWSQGGTGAPIVRGTIGQVLAAHFNGFELAEVQMVQRPNLKRPARPTKRVKARVWLPYEGPPLRYLHTTTCVHLDADRSTGHFEIDCKMCGRRDFAPEGVEEHTVQYGPYRAGGPAGDTPIDRARNAGAGVYVRAANLRDADVFRIEEVPHLRFCTDRFREFVLEEEYTNVTFWEYGEIL
jgi:hypothetical protein